MNPMRLMNPSRKCFGMILLVYPRNQTKMEKLKLMFLFKGCLGMPFQVYLKMNSDNAQINLKCITWKNEEQEPQADSVKAEPSDIMMGTMPTQRKFNLTKARGKDRR